MCEQLYGVQLPGLAFVGRSLGEGDSRGGQNMLEPAALGVPVVYGPYTDNFREDAERLASAGGAETVDGPQALFTALETLLHDDDRRRQMAAAARRVIDDNRGATGRNIAALAALLERRSGH